jgi:hypothetical protein
MFSGVDSLLDFRTVLIPDSQPVTKELADTVQASIDATVRHSNDRISTSGS